MTVLVWARAIISNWNKQAYFFKITFYFQGKMIKFLTGIFILFVRIFQQVNHIYFIIIFKKLNLV